MQPIHGDDCTFHPAFALPHHRNGQNLASCTGIAAWHCGVTHGDFAFMAPVTDRAQGDGGGSAAIALGVWIDVPS